MKGITKSVVAMTIVVVLSFALLWGVTTGEYPVAKTVAQDPALPVIEANGYRFHGEQYGDPDKPVVIVLHGGPGWDYRSLLPLRALADDYHVVFYDQRGSGLSPRVDASELSLEIMFEDLDAIVEKYRHGGQVILIGHSWGAMLATAYLGRQPEKVSRAVLAEPGFLTSELLQRSGVHMGPRWEPGYLWFAGRKWFESLHIDEPDGDAARDYFMAEAAVAANPEYYCHGAIPEVARLRWRAGATAMQSVLGSARDGEGRLHLDFTRGLERFTAPILMMASECNSLIGIAQQRRQLELLRNARMEVVKASGHMMFAEQPAVTVAMVRRFLADTAQ